MNYPGTAEQWFDPSAFSVPAAGVFGNARRNSLRGPGLKVADVSVFKNFTLGRYIAQFRIEAFNAFNLVNLGLPDATIFTAGGVRKSDRGSDSQHVDAGAAVPDRVEVPVLSRRGRWGRQRARC